MKTAKIFVLDTNVILHDYNCIKHFQDNDVVVPVTVIEELDKFKKGNDELAYNARGFMRTVDKMLGKGQKHEIPIGPGLGNLIIEPCHPFPDKMKDSFIDDVPDHRILSVAIWMRDQNPDRFTALVSKDINLRIKAMAAGMEAQDYLRGRVSDESIQIIEKELEFVNHPSAELLNELSVQSSADWKLLQEKEPMPNQTFKIKKPNGEEICAKYDSFSKKIRLVKKSYASGISPRNDEQKFALDACLNPNVQLVSLSGGAGTGKTLLALAAALELENEYEQIIITRPTIVLGNQDIGYLPGDQRSKMEPFLQPLMDNLEVIKSQFKPTSKQYQKINEMVKSQKLLITPLAYIRGRSLGKVFFIIDEAQNLTPHEVKTIITRAGNETKLVFTGDIAQIDQPYLDRWSNGLTHLNDKMKGQKLFQHVFLRKGERSELSEIASKLL